MKNIINFCTIIKIYLYKTIYNILQKPNNFVKITMNDCYDFITKYLLWGFRYFANSLY